MSRDAVYIADAGLDQVARLSLETGEITSHATVGFIYSELGMFADGDDLYAVARSDADSGDGLDLLRMSLSDFDASGENRPEVIELSETGVVDWWAGNVRFIDGWVVAAMNDGKGYRDRSDVLVAHELATGETHRHAVEHPIERLERLHGIGVVAITSSRDMIGMNTLVLEGGPTMVISTFDGELGWEPRTHAFFYKPNKDPMTGGHFGVPAQSDDGYWGAAGLAFFSVSSDGEVARVGRVEPTDVEGPECETSCTDWYGQSRPVFLFDRVYALMGYELAEVAWDDGVAMQETGRLTMSLD